ncbi:Intraflagellar transport protein 43 [Borealophlyctis nickersoniae]|nr:Intraflagellar transport protein 43 [Borealophlyctis nickersoniae]
MAVIPDLADVQDDEMMTSVAAPPSVKVGRVKTIRELDGEVVKTKGVVSEPPSAAGIDLTLLSSIALCPLDQITEPDAYWDWDVIFTEVSSEIQMEMEEARRVQAASLAAAASSAAAAPAAEVGKAGANSSAGALRA